jgi:NADP-dependent 3-hydroxy acid dehydrogenase YdfG
MNILLLGANSDIGKKIFELILKSNNVQNAIFVSRSKIKSTIKNENFHYLDGVDLTNAKDIKKVLKKVENVFKSEFIVIHSIGNFWNHIPLDECSMEKADEMMKSQYLTLYGIINALIPNMKKVGGGKFIAFSCNSVVYNYPELAPFTASKAAIETLIKCVANEYSKNNIYANVIALPTILTEKVRKNKPNGDHENYITDLELAEIILAEIAQLSKYITGNVIKVFKYSDTFYHKSYFDRNPSGRKIKSN